MITNYSDIPTPIPTHTHPTHPILKAENCRSSDKKIPGLTVAIVIMSKTTKNPDRGTITSDQRYTSVALHFLTIAFVNLLQIEGVVNHRDLRSKGKIVDLDKHSSAHLCFVLDGTKCWEIQ